MGDLVLLLWGAGGHGKVVLEVARAMGGFKTIFFIDDACEKSAREFCDWQVFGASRYLQLLKGKGCSQYLVSIGKSEMRAAGFREASKTVSWPSDSPTRLR